MALLLTAASSAAAAQTFKPHPELFYVGPNPTSIVAADLTGDGIPEIVTSDRGRLADLREERPAEDRLSYLVAQEPLVYQAQPQLRTGFGPYEVVAANIDALKAQDLVVANFLAVRNRDITLLRNFGKNIFEPHHFTVPEDALQYTKTRDGEGHPIFASPGLTSIAIEDFNHDGFRDLVATGWSSDVLVYLPGDPETFFAEPIITPLEGGPRDVAVGDVNQDGEFDLIVALYSSNTIALLAGDGTGRFQEIERFASRGALPNTVRWADVNMDRKPDIVVSHAHTDDSVVIFYGSAGPSFAMSQEIVLGKDRHKLEFGISDLQVEDFNGDGRNDLALACHQAAEVIVLLNDSKNTTVPQAFRRETYPFEKGRPRALCVQDFNQDHKPDLGVALWEENAVALLLAR